MNVVGSNTSPVVGVADDDEELELVEPDDEEHPATATAPASAPIPYNIVLRLTSTVAMVFPTLVARCPTCGADARRQSWEVADSRLGRWSEPPGGLWQGRDTRLAACPVQVVHCCRWS
ncbi:hypothetical protein GCM10009619_26700 [Williamsia maris]